MELSKLLSMFLILVDLLPLHFATKSRIIPLTIISKKLNWKEAVFACEGDFDVRLVSDAISPNLQIDTRTLLTRHA